LGSRSRMSQSRGRGVDPHLNVLIIHKHLRSSSTVVPQPMRSLCFGLVPIQLKVDQGGNTVVEDDHERNQKNNDRPPNTSKRSICAGLKLKPRTMSAVGLLRSVTRPPSNASWSACGGDEFASATLSVAIAAGDAARASVGLVVRSLVVVVWSV
jgi:hypothetical protein